MIGSGTGAFAVGERAVWFGNVVVGSVGTLAGFWVQAGEEVVGD